MANTRRKTTVSQDVDREHLLALGVERFKYSTFNDLDRQDASGPSSTHLEQVVPLIAKLAATATALHTDRSGSTVSVAEGSMAGLPRFAVCTHPERTVELTVVPTWNLVFAFSVLNLDLLLQLGYALGTWFHLQRKRHVLDIVECPSSLYHAIRLGLRYGQDAIYDLEADREISLLAGRIAATRFGEEGD